MKFFQTLLWTISALAFIDARAFTPNNLVICRVGNGEVLSANAASVFLEEYSSLGAPIASYPIAPANAFSVIGNDVTTCLINRSDDQRYILLGGYQALAMTPVIAQTDASAVARIIIRINSSNQVEVVRRLTDGFSGDNTSIGGGIRSVASANGEQFWVSGFGKNYPDNGQSGDGLRYATSAMTDGSSNVVSTGRRYIGGLSYFENVFVQTGLPPPSNNPNNPFPAVQTFFFPQFSLLTPPPLPANTQWSCEAAPTGAILTPSSGWVTPAIFIGLVNNTRVMYVADQNPRVSGVANVIHKYTNTPNTNDWSYKGSSLAVPSAWRGFTGRVNTANQQVELFGTTDQALFSLVDNSGPNGSIDNFVPQNIATAPAQTVFRGIALTPEIPNDVIFKDDFE